MNSNEQAIQANPEKPFPPRLTVELDLAHVAIGNVDSILSVCYCALRAQDDAREDVAVTLDTSAYAELLTARKHVEAAIDLLKGVRHE
jgi:hypothetical protein